MPAPSATRRGLTTSARVICYAAFSAALLTGCSDEPPRDPGGSAGSGPLITSLDAGGNSVYPPEGAGATWSATFGSLLICSPEPVTIARVVPHLEVGSPVAIDFLVRRVPALGDRPGSALAWAPVGTATEPPAELAQRGELRYASLVEARDAEVDQPCNASPDASYTEILTTITSDTGGAWIDHVDVTYDARGESYWLPVNWSYVACGELIDDPEIC